MEHQAYLTQTIYSMAGYRTLQQVVSSYFARKHWYCGEDPEDDLRAWPLIERWSGRRDRCFVSAIPMRSWYSLVGHGVSVEIINHKRLVQHGGPFERPDFRWLFPGIPNRVTVDSHYRFLSDANFVARELALRMAEMRGTIVLLDVDDEATRVKTSPLLKPEERFARLARRTSDYLPLGAGLSVIRKQLRRAAGPAWPALSAEARRFLLTGLVLYEEYDATVRVLLEASPGIVAFASALELEVNRRVLDAFRQWLVHQGQTPAARGDLKPFAAASAPDFSRTLELGRMGFLLRLVAGDRGASAQPISQAFRAFCQARLSDPAFVLDELPGKLLLVARRFRNPAAHPKLVEFHDFQDFFKLLLAADGSGLLQRMLIATSTPRESV